MSVEGRVLGLPSSRVCKLLKMPPSTLNYWVQIGLVTPTLRAPAGRRAEQWWTIRDVVIVRAVRSLRQCGASMQQVRKAKKWIESVDGDLANIRLFWDGRDIVVTDEDGVLQSAVRHPGQLLLHVAELPLSQWAEDATCDEGARERSREDFKRQNRSLVARRSRRVEPTYQALGDRIAEAGDSR